MDVALEKRQVERAYELYAPIYDVLFDWIFAPGRAAAIKQLGLARGDSVLEVGIGTGLNLPLYPPGARLTGIDLSQEMLDKAIERVQQLAMPDIALNVMDATAMDFADNDFDKAVATYTISAVPDPVAERAREHVIIPGEVPSPLNPPSGCVFRTRCPMATEECSLAIPELRRLGEDHHAACIKL